MTYVLNNYVIPGKITYEPIIKGMAEASFEDYVVEKINKYCGYTVRDLCEEFQVDFQKKTKNLEAMLAYRILGIKGNHAEEFEKANIVVKTIRIEKNNKIRENMSFPTFKFKELVEEEWDESTFGNYLRETRFLFVVYKYNGENELRLKGCQFWNIPYKDLEGDVKSVWEATKQVVLDGLEIKVRKAMKLKKVQISYIITEDDYTNDAALCKSLLGAAEKLVSYYDELFELHHPSKPKSKEGEKPMPGLKSIVSSKEAVTEIKNYIFNRGFDYPDGMVENFYLSLKSKPFVRIKTEGIAQYEGGIPDNLYVVGTVNMDETTFPFSKKVLDRANTIECSAI